MRATTKPMPDWERYLLLTLLGPVFWLQARHVRRVTPRMPEPAGSRSGVCGSGPLVRVLMVGDSAAAGVGVASQDEALCGQLIQRLGQHRTIAWRLLAMNGLDSPGLVQMLENAPSERFDVVVSMGANDVTALLPPSQWLAWQDRLAHVGGSPIWPPAAGAQRCATYACLYGDSATAALVRGALGPRDEPLALSPVGGQRKLAHYALAPAHGP